LGEAGVRRLLLCMIRPQQPEQYISVAAEMSCTANGATALTFLQLRGIVQAISLEMDERQ